MSLVHWLVVCLVVLLARPAYQQGAQQCPPANTITPCSCTVKKNGLDILCEFTEQQHIQKVIGIIYFIVVGENWISV